MALPTNSGHLSLAILASVSALIGAGWSLAAFAGQASRRPVIPKPSQIRPMDSTQAPISRAPSPGTQSPRTPGSGKSDDTPINQVDFHGIEGFFDEKSGLATAQDFVYSEKDLTVKGAKARYGKRSKILEAEGSLVLDDPKHHMTGDKARYDSHTEVKHAIITGSVVIVMKPKENVPGDPAGDVDKEKSKGATAYCDQLDYYKLKDVAILKGHLVFKQTITKDNGRTVERTVTAEHAEYDGATNKMHLFPPVNGTDTDDQKFHADDHVYVGTKVGEETITTKGPFHATFNTSDEDAPSKSGAKPGDKSAPAGDAPIGAGKQDIPDNGKGKQGDPPTGTDSKQLPPAKKEQ